jgi:hypothetical protein
MNEEHQDQQAREQLAHDLIEAHGRARAAGDQQATQEAFIHLGVLPDAITSGEFAMVCSAVGGTVGSLIDDGATLADVELAVLGNREVLHRLAIMPSRREQLRMFLDFGDQQMARLCRPGTSLAVLAALFSILSKTFTAVGLIEGGPFA